MAESVTERNSASANKDAERLELIRRVLAEQELDAVVCAHPLNVLMLSGYWPVVGHSICLATREGQITLIVPEDEQLLAERSQADEILTFRAGSLHELKTLQMAISDPIQEALEVLHGTRQKVGIEYGPESIPTPYAAISTFGMSLREEIRSHLPSAEIRVGDRAIKLLRSIKSEREIGIIRRACEIAGNAFEEGVSDIRAGMTETEVASLIRRHLGKASSHWDRADGFVYCMSGPNASAAYAAFQMSSDRIIENGDLVLVHCNSYLNGYWTDITRTVPIGGVNDTRKDVLKAIQEARLAALRVVRPGVRAHEVDAAARHVMARYGLAEEFRHPLGHGVGFNAIDHLTSPVLSPASFEAIEEGMVFNIEPGAYRDLEWGARHCDVVALTKKGPEVLSDF